MGEIGPDLDLGAEGRTEAPHGLPHSHQAAQPWPWPLPGLASSVQCSRAAGGTNADAPRPDLGQVPRTPFFAPQAPPLTTSSFLMENI